MNATDHLRTDITWKELAQALGFALQCKKEILKARMYESLLRFPIIDWEYADKRSAYHTALASLALMKAAVLLYSPYSQVYRQIAKTTTDYVEEYLDKMYA